MKRDKFPEMAKLQITRDEALRRILNKVSTQERFKDKNLINAIELIHRDLGLFQLLTLWPASEVAEVLSHLPDEYFVHDVLVTAVRQIWGDSIPKFDALPSGRNDNILVYDYEVERDGWGLETGWILFDFAVFKNMDYDEPAFSGTVRTSIDVLDATDDELKAWIYTTSGWEFEQKSIEEMYKGYSDNPIAKGKAYLTIKTDLPNKSNK